MSRLIEHKAFIKRWKASGKPVDMVTCPHCKRGHEVTAIPATDTLSVCPHCDELYFKVVSRDGTACISMPGGGGMRRASDIERRADVQRALREARNGRLLVFVVLATYAGGLLAALALIALRWPS